MEQNFSKTVEKFIRRYDGYDVQVEDISKDEVHVYVEGMRAELTSDLEERTINNRHVHKIDGYLTLREKLTPLGFTMSPFKGIISYVKKDGVTYEMGQVSGDAYVLLTDDGNTRISDMFDADVTANALIEYHKEHHEK